MPDLTNHTILIVDDSTVMRTILSNHLGERGFTILQAKDGHDGYKMYKKHLPDLILSDVNMPIWNGFDLCKIIKFDPNYNGVPVALITSSINQEFLIKSISVGADLFVTRPYQESTLIAQVEQLLEKGGWIPSREELEIIEFNGQEYQVPTDWKRLSDIMLNAYLAVIHQNTLLSQLSNQLSKTNKELTQSKNEIRRILTNTIPEKVVDKLMDSGYVEPVLHEQVTVMFTDFVGFTRSVETMHPSKLVKDLDYYFSFFDDLISIYGLEKIKTIGDSYMLAAGIPEPQPLHALSCLTVAFEILNFVESIRDSNGEVYYWPIRIGLHTGPIVAGIIGNKRFAYDIWGSNVNIASRMESAAQTNSVCVSESTLRLIADYVEYTEWEALGKDWDVNIRMYLVHGFKKEYASEETRYLPNQSLSRLLIVKD